MLVIRLILFPSLSISPSSLNENLSVLLNYLYRSSWNW